MSNLGSQFDQPALPGTEAAATSNVRNHLRKIDAARDQRLQGASTLVAAPSILAHASDHEFNPGDVVMPGKYARRNNWQGLSSSDHAYAMAVPKRTTEFRDDKMVTTSTSSPWGEHSYEVEPLSQDYSTDPNFYNADESVRSTRGFAVKSRLGRERMVAGVPPIMRGFEKTVNY